jgi:hypothetical protein
MTRLTQSQLRTELAVNLASNNRGAITAEKVRQYETDVLDTLGEPIDPYNLAQYSGASDCRTALQATLDMCFGSADSPHGDAGAALNNPFILPPGLFNISAPLTLRSVRGGMLRGATRMATTIKNTNGGSVFVTNGFEFSCVEDMSLQSAGTAPLFDLDWDNTGSTALQSNTFSDMLFEGGSSGIRVGHSGFMGSEGLILNCFFANSSSAGLLIENFNALQWSILGGNFQGCAIGVHVFAGSVPEISGVGFQNGSGLDIQIDNAVNDGYAITGCRTETENFINCPVGTPLSVIGCTQQAPGSGYFVQSNGPVFMSSNGSANGQLRGSQNGEWRLAGNYFGRSDFITSIGALFYLGNRFPPPVNTVAPAISGTAQVGQTLSCSTGTWAGNDFIAFRTWFVNGVEVSRQNTYVPVTGDIGHTITCLIAATSYNGGTSFASSAATAAVIA